MRSLLFSRPAGYGCSPAQARSTPIRPRYAREGRSFRKPAPSGPVGVVERIAQLRQRNGRVGPLILVIPHVNTNQAFGIRWIDPYLALGTGGRDDVSRPDFRIFELFADGKPQVRGPGIDDFIDLLVAHAEADCSRRPGACCEARSEVPGFPGAVGDGFLRQTGKTSADDALAI